ncbi:hypothetical protein HYW29_02485 [Candidatus Amesbacteria bacterium]|nr:hypothetical protein [Candidatus Amesbacteria bacterium]
MIKREIVLALVGLALIGGGVFWWRSGGVEQDKIEIIENNEKKAGNIKGVGVGRRVE